MQSYLVRKIEKTALEDVDFSKAVSGKITNVREESSDHHPDVTFRVLHDEKSLYVCFDVKDQYVRAVHTELHDSVCEDSCVEFFVKPVDGKGYFNMEVNAGGTFLLSYVEDPRRVPTGLAKCTLLPADLCKKIEVQGSLPKKIEPEITEPTAWTIRYRIPLEVFQPFVGEMSFQKNWRGNFYKCGDKTSHPHWLSWEPVLELNFHLPQCFGELKFE